MKGNRLASRTHKSIMITRHLSGRGYVVYILMSNQIVLVCRHGNCSCLLIQVNVNVYNCNEETVKKCLL